MKPAERPASGAVLSSCGTYRYLLDREWDRSGGTVVFVMLNPSTADAHKDDPTIRRCVGFAKWHGFGRLVVVNLYAYRATDPFHLCDAAEVGGIDIVGPKNDEHIAAACAEADTVIAAWGAHPYGKDARRYGSLPRNGTLQCLGITKDGSPRHPLYVRGDAPLSLWTPLAQRGAK